MSSRSRKNCYFATLSDRRGRQFRCFHPVRQIGIGHVDGWMQRAFFLCCGAVLPPKKGVCSAAGPVQSGFCISENPTQIPRHRNLHRCYIAIHHSDPSSIRCGCSQAGPPQPRRCKLPTLRRAPLLIQGAAHLLDGMPSRVAMGRAKAWCGFFGRRFFAGINGARNWHRTGACSGDAPGQTTALLHNPCALAASISNAKKESLDLGLFPA